MATNITPRTNNMPVSYTSPGSTSPPPSQASSSASATLSTVSYSKPTCTHYNPATLNLQHLKDTFHSPATQELLQHETLHCANCGDDEEYQRSNLWVCLQCASNPAVKSIHDIIRCGRYNNKHALEHYQRHNTHTLSIHLMERAIYCYVCDSDWSDEDLQRSNLLLIRDAIQAPSASNAVDEPAASSTSSSDDQEMQHEPTQQAEHQQQDMQEEVDSALTHGWLDYYRNAKGGHVGLSNLGNTCFMNGGLQSLLHCPPLVAFFSELDPTLVYNILTQKQLLGFNPNSLNYQTFNERIRLVESFSVLMRKVWSGEYNVCAPRDLLRDIITLNPFFRGYGQHDSHEFIRCLLDNLHECVKVVYEYQYTSPELNGNVTAKFPTPPPNLSPRSRTLSGYTGMSKIDLEVMEEEKENHLNANANAKKAQPLKRKYENSIIEDIFGGLVRSQVQCSNCNHISEVNDPFYDLSLEIPRTEQLKRAAAERGTHILNGSSVSSASSKTSWFTSITNMVGITDTPLSLQLCLHSFCTSDGLQNQDQYKCENCKQKVDAVKTMSIGKLPEVLCIHLKRFSHNSIFSSKINRHVSFPMKDLDMQPYIIKPTSATSTSEKSSTDNKSSKEKGSDKEKGNVKSAKSSKDIAGMENGGDASIYAECTLYDLFGVVKHMGSTGGGHYIGYAKNHITNEWSEFDDRTVRPVTEDKIQKQEAYILFYRRHSNKQGVALVEKALEDVGAWNVDHARTIRNEPTVYISRYWLKKVQVLGRAEPIDNRDLCCRHGKALELPPDGGDKAFSVSLSDWRKLVSIYGGGPLASGIRHPCDACSLPLIRQEEKNRISKIDGDASANSSPDAPFYLVHSPWLQAWRQFIQQDKDRPGPISNHMLVEEEDGITPRPGLIKGQDYRGLHKAVYEELARIYGNDGPVLVRRKLNIYEPPLDPAHEPQQPAQSSRNWHQPFNVQQQNSQHPHPRQPNSRVQQHQPGPPAPSQGQSHPASKTQDQHANGRRYGNNVAQHPHSTQELNSSSDDDNDYDANTAATSKHPNRAPPPVKTETQRQDQHPSQQNHLPQPNHINPTAGNATTTAPTPATTGASGTAGNLPAPISYNTRSTSNRSNASTKSNDMTTSKSPSKSPLKSAVVFHSDVDEMSIPPLEAPNNDSMEPNSQRHR